MVEMKCGDSIEIPCGDGRGAQWVDNGKSVPHVVTRNKIEGETVHKSFSLKKNEKGCWVRAKVWLEADA